MVVDDVSFECPAGELPCVVIVTAVLDADGELTGSLNVISLGGAATVGNSMAVVNTIAAIALYSPATGLAPNAIATTSTILKDGND